MQTYPPVLELCKRLFLRRNRVGEIQPRIADMIINENQLCDDEIDYSKIGDFHRMDVLFVTARPNESISTSSQNRTSLVRLRGLI